VTHHIVTCLLDEQKRGPESEKAQDRPKSTRETQRTLPESVGEAKEPSASVQTGVAEVLRGSVGNPSWRY